MTLEVALEDTLVETGGSLWDAYFTDRDFRIEDLEDYYVGMSVPVDPAPELLDAIYPEVFGSADCSGNTAKHNYEAATDNASGRASAGTSQNFEGTDNYSNCSSDTGSPGSGSARRHQSQLVWESGRRDIEPEATTASDASASETDSDSDAESLSGRVVLTGLEELELQSVVDALSDLAGLRAWTDAVEARLVARIAELTEDWVAPMHQAGSERTDMTRAVTASEVALALNIPERTATGIVDDSVLLADHHAATLSALTEGKISRRHAVLIAQECLGVPTEAVTGFEKELLVLAEDLTVPKLARRARRLREEHHPETLPARKVKAVSERHVEMRPDDDGMAWLHAYLPAEQACAVYNRLTSVGRTLTGPDEPRTLTQLRADVFTDLLTHTCLSGHKDGTVTSEPVWRDISASVNVTVPVMTLLDVLNRGTAGESTTTAEPDAVSTGVGTRTSDSASTDTDTDTGTGTSTETETGAGFRAEGLNRFAELEGYGPIDAETAARLAAHAPSFTRLLTHPVTGSILDVGRETYRPPKHLQDWIRARDKTCRHPGCSRTATSCEIDHTIPWAQGGTTSHCNLACLCPKHHRFKSEGVLHYSQPEPGTITVTTRAGTTRTTKPDPPF